MKNINDKVNDIIKKVLSGKFEEAMVLTEKFSYSELEELLLKICFDYGQSVTVYAFVVHLIHQKEDIQLHLIAQSILCNPLSYIEGSYETALYHNRRILDVDNKNIQAKIMMLFYNELPIPLIDDKEAYRFASEILEEDENNNIALKYLAENKFK